MGTISKITNKKGVSYRVQIRKFKDGKIIYTEAQTFPKKSLAEAFNTKREAELQAPGALDKKVSGVATLASLISKYDSEFCEKAGKTKKARLLALSKYPFTNRPYTELMSEDYIQFAAFRRKEGAAPPTILQDLIWLKGVIKTAYPAWGIKIDISEIDAAMTLLRKKGLIHKSEERERRPTDDELKKLTEYFHYRDLRSEIPMTDIMWFAIHSSRREAEITRLQRSDNDKENRTGLVRDIKHPRKKAYHKRFKYHDKAWAIAERQPDGDIIFPYSPRSVSSAFTRACKVLGIEGLTFHDLRHEATSRLFEEGYSIPEVQMFTLHESWGNLSRYANLRPSAVRSLPERADHAQPSSYPDGSPDRELK